MVFIFLISSLFKGGSFSKTEFPVSRGIYSKSSQKSSQHQAKITKIKPKSSQHQAKITSIHIHHIHSPVFPVAPRPPLPAWPWSRRRSSGAAQFPMLPAMPRWRPRSWAWRWSWRWMRRRAKGRRNGKLGRSWESEDEIIIDDDG